MQIPAKRRHLQVNNYQMNVGLDTSGEHSQKFSIQGTPTLIYLNKNQKIDYMTTDLSPLLSLRVKGFLINHIHLYLFIV